MYYKPLDEVVEEQRAWATGNNPRIPTGYPILDARSGGGAATGEVILFQARSQVGKTVFACNVIENNCPLPTVFFSLEMHGRYIANRLAAIHSLVSTKVIEATLQTRGNHPALDRLVDDFPKLAIIDKPSMSLKDMAVAIDEASDVWGEAPKLVVIDFMELIGGAPTMSQVEQVDRVSRKVKDLSREKDVVILLLHQVGRGEGSAGHLPLSLASGRYGGETSADYVLGAYRPCLRPGIRLDEYHREVDQFFLQFLKTRSGGGIHPAGLLHRLDPETLRLTTWDVRRAPASATVPEWTHPILATA